MAETFRVVVEAEPDPNVMGVVVTGLTEYNASKADGDVPDYLVITVRGQDDRIEGGLIGGTYLGWLQVQAVWVSEALRGLGHGTALMDAAENEAIRRGCPRAFLETLSFQALPFYEKRGYKVFSKLPDYPPGGCRYALTKDLHIAAPALCA